MKICRTNPSKPNNLYKKIWKEFVKKLLPCGIPASPEAMALQLCWWEELAKGALDGLVTSAPTPWDPDQPKPTDPPTNIQNFFLTKK